MRNAKKRGDLLGSSGVSDCIDFEFNAPRVEKYGEIPRYKRIPKNDYNL